MNILNVIQIFSALIAVITFTVATEIVELKPNQRGEKLLCALPGKTYCLNVVDYPREEIEKLVNRLGKRFATRHHQLEASADNEKNILEY